MIGQPLSISNLHKTYPGAEHPVFHGYDLDVEAGGLWAVLWYGLVLLGFGVAPAFPPAIAVGTGLLLVAAILFAMPRWAASPRWERRHIFCVIFGTMFGAMLVSFVGFIGAAPMDLYFKIVVNVLAVGCLIALGRRIREHST